MVLRPVTFPPGKPVVVDVARAEIHTREGSHTLSADEMVILRRLRLARGGLVPANVLEEAILNETTHHQDTVTEAKCHIYLLRKKLGSLGKTVIYCRRNLGYGLEVDMVDWRECPEYTDHDDSRPLMAAEPPRPLD